MIRRDFLKATAGTVLPLATVQFLENLEALAGEPATAPCEQKRGDMIYRPLGRTGERVSIVGLGGFHLGKAKDTEESVRIVRTAVDRGVTFMDNCWDYNDGESEIRMGKALRDGYREKVFLMTKFDGRTKEAAAQQIDESLRRLQTDHLDLVQVHENIRMEDGDRVFAPAGAMEAVRVAKAAGKLRFVGFTGHKDPAVHLRMLEVAARHNFRFDTVQMPLNVMDAQFRSFGQQVLPRLVKDEIGVLGMKPMGSGLILKSGVVTAPECLRFAMSLPTSTVITGVDSMPILDQALAVVRSFQPLTQEQMATLLARTAQAAADGRYELFKTDKIFDSTALHPQWLG